MERGDFFLAYLLIARLVEGAGQTSVDFSSQSGLLLMHRDGLRSAFRRQGEEEINVLQNGDHTPSAMMV